MSESKQWRDLCHLASIETDPAKLELLFEEIRRLLEQASAETASERGVPQHSFLSRYQN